MHSASGHAPSNTPKSCDTEANTHSLLFGLKEADGLGLLNKGRSVTFLVVLINIVLQLGIFLFSLHQIIDNYYQDFKTKKPLDYAFHHICFFLFVLFESVTAGICLWICVHGTSSFLRWLLASIVRWLLGSAQPHNASGTDRKEGADLENGRTISRNRRANVSYSAQTYKQTGRPSKKGRVCGICSLVMSTHEILLIGFVEMILFVVCVLESKLLADMSVHFIDLDLVDIMGLKSVLKRQQALGAGIAEEHWRYIHIVIVLLLTAQFGIYYLAKYLDKKISGKWKTKALMFSIALSLVLFGLAPFEHRILSERQNHFRSLLPFNFFDKQANQGYHPPPGHCSSKRPAQINTSATSHNHIVPTKTW